MIFSLSTRSNLHRRFLRIEAIQRSVADATTTEIGFLTQRTPRTAEERKDRETMKQSQQNGGEIGGKLLFALALERVGRLKVCAGTCAARNRVQDMPLMEQQLLDSAQNA